MHLLLLLCAQIGGYCTHESTLEELGARTVDPQYSSTKISKPVPAPPVPLPDVSKPGSCNLYIPPADTGSTMDRYLWTVQWLVANGWYVLIDYHPMVSGARGRRRIGAVASVLARSVAVRAHPHATACCTHRAWSRHHLMPPSLSAAGRRCGRRLLAFPTFPLRWSDAFLLTL